MTRGKNAIRTTVTAFMLLPMLCAHAADGMRNLPATEFSFHAVVPLGVDAFTFRDAKQTMYLLASARDPQFEGLRRVSADGRRVLLDAGGKPVEFYPEVLRFRVTASTRLKLLGISPWPEVAGRDLNRYMLGLRFQLRIFRGLQQRLMMPAAVRMIGMPADVAYDERVFQLSFPVGRLPMSDRVVLEVWSPQGTRLSRFHLDLD